MKFAIFWSLWIGSYFAILASTHANSWAIGLAMFAGAMVSITDDAVGKMLKARARTR